MSATVTAGGNTTPSSGTVETWTVTASGFPSAPFKIIDSATSVTTSEMLTVTAGGNGTGVSWTVVRGDSATTPVAHGSNFTVNQVIGPIYYPFAATGNYLVSSNNLSDITDASAARTNLGVSGGGGGTTLVPTAVKTANYTAAGGDFVPVDTTSSNVTITLPTAPADATQIAVKQIIQASSHTISVATGGSDVFNKTGGSTTFTITLLNQGVTFQYKSSTHIWYVLSDDLSLAQLDARYSTISSAANSFRGNNTGSTANTVDLTVAQAKTLLAISLTTDVTGTLQAAQHPALTGDVTNSAGSLATTIANGSVTLAKQANFAASSFRGNNTGSPATGIDMTVSQAKTLLAISLSTDVSGTLQAGQVPAFTGDVTTSAGNLATTIAANAVTNAKAAQMATRTLKGNNSGSTGNSIDLTIPQFDTMYHGNGGQPSDYSLLQWNYDVAQANASTALATAGTVYVQKLYNITSQTITNVCGHVATAGGTLTSGQCFAALYSGAGSLLSTTADQATAWASTGFKTMALGSPQTLGVGFFYVAWFFNGTTGPAFVRGGNFGAINLNLSNANSRWATADTGRTTTMPSSLGTFTGANTAYWAGVS